MGVNRPTIPILAIILAVSGLGLGALTFISVSRIDAQVDSFSDQNSWYKYNGTKFISDPTSTYLTFSGLTIEFELGQNESVYFSYTE